MNAIPSCLVLYSVVIAAAITLQVANGFVVTSASRISMQQRDTRCVASRSTSDGTTSLSFAPRQSTTSHRIGSHVQYARRRRQSTADNDDDEYDDEYIDAIINEKFDDFDDDFDDLDSSKVDARSSDAGDKYEYARVGRRRGRERGRYDEVEDGGGSDGRYDDDIDMMDDDRSSPSRGRRTREARSRRDAVDDFDDDFEDEDDYFDEDYEKDYDDDDDDFEEGILIPNPILDAVDPEGAADRIGELFVDPKWWRDVASIAFVVAFVYLYTYNPGDLVPWDSVTPDDFDLNALYER